MGRNPTEISCLEAVELLAQQLLQGPFPNVMSYTSTMSACEKAGTHGFMISLCVARCMAEIVEM